MRSLVVLCVIAALATPSLGRVYPRGPLVSHMHKLRPRNAEAPANAEAQPAEAPTPQPAEAPTPQPAETPENEAARPNENSEAAENPPKIAEPQIDPTPAPGEEPIIATVPAHEPRPFSNFLHSLYDRFPFHLPDFHLPSLWPFRRGFPPRGRFSPRESYPAIYIVRESEPDYY